MDGEPIAVDLLVDVGNAKGKIQGVAILGGTRDAEEEAPIREVALGLAFPTADRGTNAAWVCGQKVRPVLAKGCAAPTYWRGGMPSKTTSVSPGTLSGT